MGVGCEIGAVDWDVGRLQKPFSLMFVARLVACACRKRAPPWMSLDAIVVFAPTPQELQVSASNVHNKKNDIYRFPAPLINPIIPLLILGAFFLSGGGHYGVLGFCAAGVYCCVPAGGPL